LKKIASSDTTANFSGSGVWVLQGHNEVSDVGGELEGILLEEFTVTKEAKFLNAWGKFYFKYRIPALNIFNFNDGNVTIDPDGESVILYTDGMMVSDPVSFPKGRYRLYIHCKGTELAGEFPHVRVQVGESEIGNFNTLNTFQDFPLSFSIDNDKSARLHIIFDNDLYDRETRKDRNLYIKSLMITGPH